MNDKKIERFIGYTIIALLIVDVLLEYHMVYGRYPWEGAQAA